MILEGANQSTNTQPEAVSGNSYYFSPTITRLSQLIEGAQITATVDLGLNTLSCFFGL